MPLPAADALYPIESIGAVADSIGALAVYPDSDGGIRAEPLVVDYYDEMYPSMALQLALRSLNLEPSDVTVNLGDSVELGRLSIKTSHQLLMNTFFYNNNTVNNYERYT